MISAGDNGSRTLTITGSEAQINKTLETLTYTGDPNYHGEDRLKVLSTDPDANQNTGEEFLIITVLPEIDGITNTLPATGPSV